MTTSRRMPLDSGSMPLEGQPRKYVRFDPTLNTGHVLQIAVFILGGFAAYNVITKDQVQQKAELDQVKAAAIVERAQTKEALADLKLDVKELRTSMQDVKESLAILRGRAAETPGSKR